MAAICFFSGGRNQTQNKFFFKSLEWPLRSPRLAYCSRVMFCRQFLVTYCSRGMHGGQPYWMVLLLQRKRSSMFRNHLGLDFGMASCSIRWSSTIFGTTDVEDVLSMSRIETIRTRDPVTDRKMKSAKVNYLFTNRMASTFFSHCGVSFQWFQHQEWLCLRRKTISEMLY